MIYKSVEHYSHFLPDRQVFGFWNKQRGEWLVLVYVLTVCSAMIIFSRIDKYSFLGIIGTDDEGSPMHRFKISARTRVLYDASYCWCSRIFKRMIVGNCAIVGLGSMRQWLSHNGTWHQHICHPWCDSKIDYDCTCLLRFTVTLWFDQSK